MSSVGPWAIRVVWFVLPLAAGPAFADALADASRPVQLVGSIGLWLAWAAVLGVTLVPRTVSLTALRMAAPAALAAAAVAATAGATGADDALALSATILAVAATWWAVTGDAFVDGSSYGDEQRFLLRAPLPLLGAALVAWLLAVVAPASGALALAAGSWIVGVVLLAVGGVGVRLGVPALHRLSRRWLVLVPAGLVVHDHVALPDPLLFRRPTLTRVGPAAPGDDTRADAVDLTLGAGGLVVELELLELTEVPVSRGAGRRREVATVEAERVLVTPARPGAFLAAAAKRLPVR